MAGLTFEAWLVAGAGSAVLVAVIAIFRVVINTARGHIESRVEIVVSQKIETYTTALGKLTTAVEVDKATSDKVLALERQMNNGITARLLQVERQTSEILGILQGAHIVDRGKE